MEILLVGINAKFIHSNLGIHSIKAYSGSEQIKVLEFTINQSEDYVLRKILEGNAKIIGFSAYIWNFSFILNVIQNIKKINKDIKVFLGGPEVSYNGREMLDAYDNIDFIISGEGEQAVSDLLNEKDFCNIKGFISKDIENNSSVIKLDDIPFVYKDGNIHLFENRILYYETQRGCPFSCSYCISSIDKGIRFLSRSRIISDLKFFLDKRVKQVKFVDRTFNADISHAMFVWETIIKNDNGVTNFHFEIAGDLLTDDSIALLKQAREGLFQFEIGVQTTNEKTLNAIRRSGDFLKIADNYNKVKAQGNIHQHLDLIAGLPYETYDTFKRSFNDVYSLKPEQLQLGFLKVLKGSSIYKDAQQFGIVYRKTPPYEVLYTKDLSYKELFRLKDIEETLETYYNSFLAVHSIGYMETFAKSPFDFYEGVTDFLSERGFFNRKHNKSVLYEFLYDYGKTLPLNERVLCNLLKFDMLLNDNIKAMPYFIEDTSNHEVLRAFMHKNSIKQKVKEEKIEFFTINPFTYKNSNTFIKFNYFKRNILTGKADYKVMTYD